MRNNSSYIDTGIAIVIGVNKLSEGFSLTAQIEEAYISKKISDRDYRKYQRQKERLGKNY